MHLESSEVNQVQIVKVPEKTLDAANSDTFKALLEPMVKNNPRIVLDMSKTTFLDSSGCGALLACYRQAVAGGGDLKLCRVQETVAALFELLKLHQVIDIHATAEEAVQEF